jgi:hypothetical protein
MPSFSDPSFFIWLFNIFVLAGILVLVYYFVIRDARKRQIKWLQTVIWAIVSVFFFPIGFLIYLLVAKKNKTTL